MLIPYYASGATECNANGIVDTIVGLLGQDQNASSAKHIAAAINCTTQDSKLLAGIKSISMDENKSNSNTMDYISANLNHQNLYANYADWLNITNKPTIVLDVATQFKTKSILWDISYSKNTEQIGSDNNKYMDLLLKLTALNNFEIFGKKLTFGYRQFNFKTTATVKDGNNYILIFRT